MIPYHQVHYQYRGCLHHPHYQEGLSPAVKGDGRGERGGCPQIAHIPHGNDEPRYGCEFPGRIPVAEDLEGAHEDACASRAQEHPPAQGRRVGVGQGEDEGACSGEEPHDADDYPAAEPVQQGAEGDLGEGEGIKEGAGEDAEFRCGQAEIGGKVARRHGHGYPVEVCQHVHG